MPPRSLWPPLACFAAACVCLILAGYDVARAVRMGRWPAVPGRVVYSDLKTVEQGERYRYSPEIEVEYTVEGRRLTTRTIRADSGMTTSDRLWAENLLNRYPKGQPVEVHYSAADPREARVETSPQPAIWVVGVWGACALFAGVALWRLRPRVNAAAGPSTGTASG
jgi:hypothetical protein